MTPPEFRIAEPMPNWRHVYDHTKGENVPKGTIGRDREKLVRTWYSLCGMKLTPHSTKTSKPERDSPVETTVNCDACRRAWAALKLAASTVEGDEDGAKFRVLGQFQLLPKK